MGNVHHLDDKERRRARRKYRVKDRQKKTKTTRPKEYRHDDSIDDYFEDDY